MWLGTLTTGGNPTPLLFILSRPSEGKIDGQVISVVRNVSHKLEGSSEGKALKWELPRIAAIFEGAMSGDGSSIEGTWAEPAGRQRLRLERYSRNSFSLPLGAEIDAFVPKFPTAVRADGRFHIAYELHVTNWADSEANVERVELTIGHEVTRIEGEPLAGLFSSRSSRIGAKNRSALILMFSTSNLPKTIQHRLVVRRADQATSISVDCARVVVTHDVVTLSPPVKGKDWVMNEGPDVPSHHRTSLLALNGTITNAQRFALISTRRKTAANKRLAGRRTRITCLTE